MDHDISLNIPTTLIICLPRSHEPGQMASNLKKAENIVELKKLQQNQGSHRTLPICIKTFWKALLLLMETVEPPLSFGTLKLSSIPGSIRGTWPIDIEHGNPTVTRKLQAFSSSSLRRPIEVF